MDVLCAPVLICGGGGAGLTASMLLSQLGVESLLVSALPTTSILPKAHVLNQRAMEILTDVGVADAIYAHGTPAENMRGTPRTTRASRARIACTAARSRGSSRGEPEGSTPTGPPRVRASRPTCRRSGWNRS